MNLVFDLDDTLYDLMEPFQRVYEAFGYGETQVLCEDVYVASRKYGDQVYDAMQRKEITMDEAFIYRTTKAFEAYGLKISKEQSLEFQKMYRKYQKEITIPKAVVEMLDFCSEKKYNMALLTNGLHEGQWGKIKTLGIERWISTDHIFVSEDVGYAKPDINIFKKVQENLKLEGQEIWYIGDTYLNDVLGPKKVGWKTIWLNKRNTILEKADAKSDYEVKSEEELKELFVRKLSS